MAIGFDAGTLEILVAFYLVMKVWNRAGGWPEAYYRARGIDYFQHYLLMPSGKVERPIHKFKDVKAHSPAFIREKTGGDYWLKDTSEYKFSNPHNAPAWFHRWDDTRPIAIDLAPGGIKADPMLVANGFDDDIFQKLNTLGDKTGYFKNPAMTFLLVAILGLTALSIYYNILYGYNLNCAIHTVVCR